MSEFLKQTLFVLHKKIWKIDKSLSFIASAVKAAKVPSCVVYSDTLS